MQRPVGYYFLKRHAPYIWVVGFWTGDYWRLIGHSRHYRDAHFNTIGDRILPPEV